MAIIVGFPGNNPLLQGTNLDDDIFGNSLGNISGVAGNDRIFGLAGDDDIAGDGLNILATGRGGDDVIQGGDGNDEIYGDASGSLYGVGGNDVLYQNGGRGLLVGDADRIQAGGRGGNDRLYGDSDMAGDSFENMIDAHGGNDLLDASSATDGRLMAGDVGPGDLLGYSTGGKDTLRGGNFDDDLWGECDGVLDGRARGGNDSLSGNGGDDRIRGDANAILGLAVAGSDVLRGGSGNDQLFGDGEFVSQFATAGADRLLGGAGDDELWGDGVLENGATGGKDRFVFSGNFGDDSVLDFRQADGDQIVLQGLTQSEVQLSIVTVINPNDSTLITTLGDQSITLVGFTGGLTPGVDIVFA